MGAVAHGAVHAAAGPSASSRKPWVHRELADVDADGLIVTDTMRQRKRVMEDRADAFVALPGRIGTLGNCSGRGRPATLGMHEKPVVPAGSDGHYDGLLAWLDGLRDGGYVAQGALDRC